MAQAKPLQHGASRRRDPIGEAAAAISESIEPFDSIDGADLEPLLNRIGDTKIVLIGEASHGTSEFYRLRARISKALIERRSFSFVAIEADWPDAARIDHYVRHLSYRPREWTAFARFPQWMWRNEEVRAFVDWLRERNAERPSSERAAFYGLDIYSLYTSIAEVLRYFDEVDPEAARLARERYACLAPWQSDPAAYGQMALSGRMEACERDVVRMLKDLLTKQNAYMQDAGESYFDAVNNARLIASAERYYRIMYYGSRESWNLRDTHMFETLNALLTFHGRDAKAIVWAHNSHLGNAAATEMSARGETNLGELCKTGFADNVHAIGFGTDHGTVAAATDWDGPMEIKRVRPSLAESYEHLCHRTGTPRFFLPLQADAKEARAVLMTPRLERAIGVIYRPQTERASHYFEAVLPEQFDDYIWFDESSAVTPLSTAKRGGVPDTYPFGL